MYLVAFYYKDTLLETINMNKLPRIGECVSFDHLGTTEKLELSEGTLFRVFDIITHLSDKSNSDFLYVDVRLELDTKQWRSK